MLDLEFRIHSENQQEVFEKAIAGRFNLQSAYVDEYSKNSDFYLTFLYSELLK